MKAVWKRKGKEMECKKGRKREKRKKKAVDKCSKQYLRVKKVQREK